MNAGTASGPPRRRHGARLPRFRFEIRPSAAEFSGRGGVGLLPGDDGWRVPTVDAGIDMIMIPDAYGRVRDTMRDLVASGGTGEARLDRAVGRVLREKFELGPFERPLADRSPLAEVGSAAHPSRLRSRPWNRVAASHG